MSSTLKYLMKVEGLSNRFNNIIYVANQKTTNNSDNKWNPVCYFGGDIQNFQEIMIQNNDHQFLEYSLENVARKLSKRFFQHDILVIQPTNVYKSFSRYENFIKSIDILGTPKFDNNDRSCYDHLLKLLKNVYKLVQNDNYNDCQSLNHDQYFEVIMIFFSKGQVVINQLARSLRLIDFKNHNPKLKLTELYFLDGGHNGHSDLWITDPELINLLIDIAGCQCFHIGVTDFQMNKSNCAAEEEEKFHKILISNRNLNVSRVHLYQKNFKNLTSIQLHFKILDLLFDGKL